MDPRLDELLDALDGPDAQTRDYFRVGDLVWYIVAPPGAARLLYAAAVIVRQGARKRFGIASVLDRRVRYVCAHRLSKLAPPDNVDIRWSEQCRPPGTEAPCSAR